MSSVEEPEAAAGPTTTPPEPRLGPVVELATRLLAAPVAAVALLDGDGLVEQTDTSEPDAAALLAFAEAAARIRGGLACEDHGDDRLPEEATSGSLHAFAGRPLRSPSGQARGALVVADHTPRAWGAAELDALEALAGWAEAELARAELAGLVRGWADRDEARTQFVRAISHELRTPLTSVMGYLETILEGAVGPVSDAQRQCIEIAHRNAARLELLSADTLTIARLDAGAIALQRAPVDVLALARERADASPLVEGVEIVVEGEPGIELRLDRARVGELLDRLIDNAVKFSSAGDTVLVRAGTDDDVATIEVLDHGLGIPEDELAYVGQRFYRASNVGSLRGSGLGVAICRHYAELHGGSLDLERRDGGGVRVVARLPSG